MESKINPLECADWTENESRITRTKWKMSVHAYINFWGCHRAILLPPCPFSAISSSSSQTLWGCQGISLPRKMENCWQLKELTCLWAESRLCQVEFNTICFLLGFVFFLPSRAKRKYKGNPEANKQKQFSRQSKLFFRSQKMFWPKGREKMKFRKVKKHH